MIDVTGVATEQLKLVREQRQLDREHGVRVARDSTGQLHLRIDEIRSDDLIVDDQDEPLIVISRDGAGLV